MGFGSLALSGSGVGVGAAGGHPAGGVPVALKSPLATARIASTSGISTDPYAFDPWATSGGSTTACATSRASVFLAKSARVGRRLRGMSVRTVFASAPSRDGTSTRSPFRTSWSRAATRTCCRRPARVRSSWPAEYRIRASIATPSALARRSVRTPSIIAARAVASVPANAPGTRRLARRIATLPTSSPGVVIDPTWIGPGTHVPSVGYHLPAGELPPALATSGHVFVETRRAFEPTPVGCGELAGLDPEAGTELGEVVLGLRPGRTSADEVTVHKAMGHAVADLAAATLVYGRASAECIGGSVEL